MIKEELEKEADEYFKTICGDYNEEYERTGKRHYFVGFDIKNAYLASAYPREKRIAELEEKISVLLSCKNCSENKGGYICQKEYEDKCLAQKIQYIKELQQENESLENIKNIQIGDLLKAKELLKRYVPYRQITDSKAFKDLADETEQFISEVEK